MPKTEYTMIPLEHKFIVSGWYLGQKFNYQVDKTNQEFRDLFFAPVDGADTSYQLFHRQMLWLKGHCPSLSNLVDLPEPKPLKASKTNAELAEDLATISLLVRGIIQDLSEGVYR